MSLLRIVVTTALLAATLVMGAPHAGAHSYYGSYTKRIYDCAVSGKYSCQAHYLLAVDDPTFGPLWRVRHSHGCTDNADTGLNWRYLHFNIHNWDGSAPWGSAHVNAHDHSSQWCGQSAGDHEFYPDVYVLRGGNTFHLKIESTHAANNSYWTNDDGLSTITNT